MRRDYLGFSVDWEHRFEPTLPLYVQVSRDDAVLHLTEHYGDGTPGSVVPAGLTAGSSAASEALF